MTLRAASSWGGWLERGLWAALLVLAGAVWWDVGRSDFVPVTVVPCAGATCSEGMPENWRAFSDAFQGRSRPFADVDWCARAPDYLARFDAASQERRFILDLMEDRLVTLTPVAEGIRIAPGPWADGPVRIARNLATFRPVGCHLSSWGLLPAMLFWTTMVVTNLRAWRRGRAAR